MFVKIETGVMIMKNGKAWGVTYEDARFTEYGWVDPEIAQIHDPAYCRKPSDATYAGSPHADEMDSGSLVMIERRTEVIVSIKNAS